ncbi:MAG: DNA-3-methyladenine glycosylase I [Chloroflexi bacterium]|nr:MAG: DNA-3-methyladenine glycosylase I [Chloroflexota bacterium]
MPVKPAPRKSVAPAVARRCGWALSAPEYLVYHDTEWGRPVLTDNGLYERLCLEGFQAGLSWITVLRRREGFRAAFKDFQIEAVARFGPREVARLLQDTHIIRHRGKIEATIENARRALETIADMGSLARLLWSFRPSPGRAPATIATIPARTPESIALSKELKRRGFRFVGATTTYAVMQACGLVNDHIRGCWVRPAVESEQLAAVRRLSKLR